ncbi:MAG: hypothetical protein NW202_04730 [Nitrospira sp.]|nr:hypothetical protein [Nitrospira sp.]
MARAVIFPEKDLKKVNAASGGVPAGQARCWRCRGLMVVEACFDFAADANQLDCLTRRCVQCGEVNDPVILQNRRLQLEKNVARV